ncbi:hypothetical protein SLEP1_g9520 [Rubroshorea leprosula]|uniref:Uncharacterized protein n=1 Tax=Rubroshorea leprosula TaxID=152421 RepID=A0AAV5IDL6_9ROSI|nr:hypothetical protein SLEP1_g9520 [Rubroshorea leprosula]
MQIRAMANNGIGVGEGFYGESVSSSYHTSENLLHGNSMDQEEDQNLRQQSGQSSPTNAILPGFLPSSITNQGSQAVAGTQQCPWLLKQFGQPIGLQELLLGFLPSLTTNQGSHQAITTEQPLIHQHFCQSLATSFGDPHS